MGATRTHTVASCRTCGPLPQIRARLDAHPHPTVTRTHPVARCDDDCHQEETHDDRPAR